MTTIWEPLQMCGAAITDKFYDNSKDPMPNLPGIPGSTPTSTFDTNPPAPSVPLPGENNPAGHPPPSPFPTGPVESAPPPAFWADPARFLREIAAMIEQDPDFRDQILAAWGQIIARLNSRK